jgi:hypothetical protein
LDVGKPGFVAAENICDLNAEVSTMSDSVLGAKAIVDSCAIMPLQTVEPVAGLDVSTPDSDCDRRVFLTVVA